MSPLAVASVAPVDLLPARPVPPDRAIRAALDAVGRLPSLSVRSAPLASCHDRVLAERVRAQADRPLRASSQVDGFAFCAEACRGNGPWRLHLTGRIAVARNTAAESAFPCRDAVRIAAGAPVPLQLDTVVPAEAVQREGAYILLTERPERGGFIHARGVDARCGDVIAQPDRLLDSRDIAALATVGITGARVRRTLRVAVLSTGTGGRQENGAASHAMIMASLDRRWIGRHDLGVARSGSLAQTLRDAAVETDMLIAIDRAGLEDAILAAGGQIVLGGIAMQPGGHAKLAILGDMALIVLPKEPVAALTAMAVLGWPLLRRRAGIQHSRVAPRAGIAAFTLPADAERAAYPLIRVAGSGTMPTIEALDGPSGDPVGTVTRLALADGIALIAPGEAVGFGSRMTWMPINDRFG